MAPRPKRRLAGSAALGIGTLVAVGLGIFYYQFFYKQTRRDYLTQRSLRQLGILAEQIAGAVDSRIKAVSNIAASASGSAITQAAGAGPEATDDIPELSRQLQLAQLGPCQDGTQKKDGKTQDSDAPPTFRVRAQDDLELRQSARADESQRTRVNAAARKRDSSLSFSKGKVCGEMRLSELVMSYLPEELLNQADVFIADDAGDILFERGRVELRIGALSIGSLPEAGKPGSATPTPTPRPASAESELPSVELLKAHSRVSALVLGGKSYLLFSHPLRPDADKQWVLGLIVEDTGFNSEVASVSIGSLGTIPLILILIGLAGPLLKVATLGERNRLRRRDVWHAAMAVVAIGGIAVPVIAGLYAYEKVEVALDEDLTRVSQQIRDHFTHELEAAAALARVFGESRAPGVATDPSQCDSKKPASPMAGAFKERIRANHLRDLEPTSILPARSDSDEVCLAALQDAYDLTDSFVLEPRWFVTVVPPSIAPTPLVVDFVGWTDSCGWQASKWTPDRTLTARIRQKESHWFEDVSDDRLWTELDRGDGLATPFSVNLQSSPNTGKLVPVVAVQRQTSDGAGTTVAWVVPRFVSLDQPVLPAGFGFAVMTNDGRVIFHSNKERSLVENLYVEVEEPRRLRSLIEARSAGVVDLEYRGRRQRAYAHPLDGLSWTLVVFRDKEVPRTIDLDVIGAWFALFAGYFLILVAWRGFSRLAFRRPDDRWSWPVEQKAVTYACCSLLLLLPLLAFLLLVICAPDHWARYIVPAFTLPIASLAFTCLAYGMDGWWRRCCAWLAFVSCALFAAFAFAAMQSCSLMLAALLLLAWLLLGGLWLLPAQPFLPQTPVVGQVVAFASAAPRWRTFYLVVAVELVALLGILPSLAFYRDAFDLGVEVLVRHGQAQMAQDLDAQERRVTEDDAQRETSDLGRIEAYRILGRAYGETFGRDGREVTCRKQAGNGFGRTWSRLVEWLTDPACRSGLLQLDEGCELVRGQHAASLPMSMLPTYHDESTAVRNFVNRRARDDARWRSTICDRRAGLEWHRLLGGPTRTIATSGEPPADGKEPEQMLAFRIPFQRFGMIISIVAIAAIAGLLALLVTWLSKWIFGWNEPDLSVPTPSGREPLRGVLYLGSVAALVPPAPGDDATQNLHQQALVLDWRVLPRKLMGRVEDKDDPEGKTFKVVVVQHFEHRIDEPAHNRAKLEALESLVYGQKRPVLVLSEIEPLRYFLRRLQSDWDRRWNKNELPEEEFTRWAQVLSALAKVEESVSLSSAVEFCLAKLVVLGGELPTSLGEVAIEAEDWGSALTALESETGQTPAVGGNDAQQADPHLEAIAANMVAFQRPCSAAGADAEREVRERFLATASNYYRSTWARLTDQECLVLIQLANEGYVNPNNWPIVRQLQRRGLLRLGRGVEFVNHSFKQFVEREEKDALVYEWEQAAGASTWDKLRNAILMVIIIGGLLTYLTQPELLTRWIGAITAIGGAATTLITMLGMFRGPRLPGNGASA